MATPDADATPTPPPATPPATASFLLEQHQRLSRSMIWRLQRRFFEDLGIDAWRKSIVPQYITSNAFMAESYARVVQAFLLESRSAPAHEASPPFDPGQPVNIVELGAGSGRFAFLFISKLLMLQRRGLEPPVKFRYIMTDFTERNVAWWENHPSLRPWLEAGLLDLARFDAERDQELELRISGEKLTPDGAANPMVALANYVFDGIAQDVFRVERGTLLEQRVSVSSRQLEPNPDDPAMLERLEFGWAESQVVADYYDDPELNQLLREYQQRLSSTTVRFPVAALEGCRHLRALAGDRLLLLSADKGHVHEDALLNQGPPALVVHGSFSLNVDYHALARYARNAGGQAHYTSYRHSSLVVAAFLFGQPPGAYAATRLAFDDAVERLGPDDFFQLKGGFETQLGQLKLDQVMAFQRFSRHDPEILRRSLPSLIELAREANSAQKRDIYRLVGQAWELYYPIGEEHDLAFEIGRLLYVMEYYPEGLVWFEHSIRLYGKDPNTLFNMALCHFQLRQLEPALQRVMGVLELDAGHEAARGMRIDLETQLRR